MMFEDLRELYQDAIMQRGKSPKHGTRLAVFDADAKGDNPMCGDRVHVFLRHEGDIVAELGFEARGCAISIASADLMAEAVAGQSDARIAEIIAAVNDAVRTGELPDPALVALKPLAAVHEARSRIKCATLPWGALQSALAANRSAHP
jgi:nitrogen fixation NifU-like protein